MTPRDTTGHHGTLWETAGHHGTPRDTTGHHGSPREARGYQWRPGTPREAMGHHGTPLRAPKEASCCPVEFHWSQLGLHGSLGAKSAPTELHWVLRCMWWRATTWSAWAWIAAFCCYCHRMFFVVIVVGWFLVLLLVVGFGCLRKLSLVVDNCALALAFFFSDRHLRCHRRFVSTCPS